MNTELQISARTKGFEQATQKAAQLGKQSQSAMAEAKKEVGRLEDNIGKLTRKQMDLNKALDQTEKGTKAYKVLASSLRDVERDATRTERALRNLKRLYPESGGGGTGGGGAAAAVPNPQRGGGMGGKMAFGAAGTIAAGAGALGIPLALAMQDAQKALGHRQAALGQMPFMGGMDRARVMSNFDVEGRAQRSAASRAERAIPSLGRIEDFRRQEVGRIQRENQWDDNPQTRRMAEVQLDKQGIDWDRLQESQRKDYLDEERRDARRARGVAAARASGTLGLEATGARFGYDKTAAMQAAGAVSAAGGGTGRDMARQGLLAPAMAAERFLGVGSDVSGAFLQGGRRGGVVGGQGRAGGALTDALKDGLKLGLEGSELQEHMSQMAGDIRGWRNTGIPVNPKSMAEIGREMGQMGLGSVRGSKVAGGIRGAVGNLMQGGVKDAGDMLLLKELGGFDGGGAKGYLQAMTRLEKGEYGGEDIQRVFKTLFEQGGGGDHGILRARDFLGQKGINLGYEEASLMGRQVQGRLTGADQKTLAKIQERQQAGGRRSRAFDPDALGVDPVLQRQARTTNQQINSGQRWVKTMQDMSSITTNLKDAFGDLASSSVASVSDALDNLARAANGATSSWVSSGGKQ